LFDKLGHHLVLYIDALLLKLCGKVREDKVKVRDGLLWIEVGSLLLFFHKSRQLRA